MSRENIPLKVDIGARDQNIRQESVVDYINSELVPLLQQLRVVANRLAEYPELPTFDDSPITDASWGARGYSPRLGLVAFSSTDNKLYVRTGVDTYKTVTLS